MIAMNVAVARNVSVNGISVADVFDLSQQRCGTIVRVVLVRHMTFVLGIDAGGHQDRLPARRRQRRSARRGAARRRQPPGAGELEVEKVLHEVMEEAIGDRDDPSVRDLPGHRRRRSAGRRARRARHHEAHRLQGDVLVVNDALVALEAGAPDEPGVVVIAGTGSIAYGRNERNQAARAGGWGYMLGDEGSGYWIGRAALRAVLREADRRGPATQLTGAAAATTSASRGRRTSFTRSTTARCGRPRSRRSRSASRRVQRTATRWRSAFCAARPTSSSRRRCRSRGGSDLVGSEFPFVLAGGMFRAVPWLNEELDRAAAAGVAAQPHVLLDVEPAVGAVRLALAEARGGGSTFRSTKAD